jgi:hypothetical protein
MPEAYCVIGGFAQLHGAEYCLAMPLLGRGFLCFTMSDTRKKCWLIKQVEQGSCNWQLQGSS